MTARTVRTASKLRRARILAVLRDIREHAQFPELVRLLADQAIALVEREP